MAAYGIQMVLTQGTGRLQIAAWNNPGAAKQRSMRSILEVDCDILILPPAKQLTVNAPRVKADHC